MVKYYPSYKTLNINYNFNNAITTQENTIWNNMRVYKVEITASNTTHEIYALDYYAFESAISGGIIKRMNIIKTCIYDR